MWIRTAYEDALITGNVPEGSQRVVIVFSHFSFRSETISKLGFVNFVGFPTYQPDGTLDRQLLTMISESCVPSFSLPQDHPVLHALESNLQIVATCGFAKIRKHFVGHELEIRVPGKEHWSETSSPKADDSNFCYGRHPIVGMAIVGFLIGSPVSLAFCSFGRSIDQYIRSL